MPRSLAHVTTDRPGRYAKQLASHLGRRLATAWDDESGVGSVEFPDGAKAELRAEPGVLVMTVDASAERLDGVEDVLGRHLVRFGAKDELVAAWRREDGTEGTTQRFAGDE